MFSQRRDCQSEQMLGAGIAPEEQVDFLIQVEAAKEAALRILDCCDQSVHQCRVKLLERGHDAEAVEAALSRLVEVGVLDDHRYAQMLARVRYQQRGLVGQALRQELVRKGISEQIVQTELSRLSEEDEYGVAVELAAKKLRTASPSLSREQLRRRVLSALARRGHSYDCGTRAFEQAWQDCGRDRDE